MVHAFYKDSKIAVLGIGRSGEAAAKLLNSFGANVSILDERSIDDCPLAKQLELTHTSIDVLSCEQITNDYSLYDFAVISPGIDPKTNLVQSLLRRKVLVIAEIELAYQNSSVPFVGITGTNGKTTTTELVATMLSQAGVKTATCGNIGKPYSELVQEDTQLDIITLEISSFQLEQIKRFRPSISVWLNFSPDHLDRYIGMHEYHVAKLRIFENQTHEDWAVVNLRDRMPKLNAKRMTFSAFETDADIHLQDETIVYKNAPILNINETKLRGWHNAENLMAALGVGFAYGLSVEQMKPGLCAYQPQAHRCEFVRELAGVTYVNDSKATNIDALEKALLSELRTIVLIAGGKDKGLRFDGLIDLVKSKVRQTILIGELATRIAESWRNQIPCVQAKDLEEAVNIARTSAYPGDVVLFSPGTSSFDMFKNYVDRGDQFKACVHLL